MMTIGEFSFDVFYLIFVTLNGIFLFRNAKRSEIRMMGSATLFLIIGEAFYLIPKILDFLFTYDFTFLLGFGKMITSFTVTFFFIFLYWIYFILYHEKEDKRLRYLFFLFVIGRFIFLILPMNHWFTNESSRWIVILRNVPFVMMGLLLILLYFKHRKRIKIFSNIWLCLLLSFLFPIPAILFAKEYPIMGSFMILKMICYIFMVNLFTKYMIQFQKR